MANDRARSFRKRPTAAETRLWKELKALRAQGFHFRRQVPIDDFIVDFACFDQRLVIEVDGSQHDEPAGLSADSARDAHLRWRGFTVMRVRNAEVLANTSGVLAGILRELGAFNWGAPVTAGWSRILTPTPNLSPQGGGGYAACLRLCP